MKTFQVSGILLICLCILHNQGYEAKSSRRHPGKHDHGKKKYAVAQQDYPNANDLGGNYLAVAKLRGYITKEMKKNVSSIIKNITASTEDTLEYKFFPSSAGVVQFKLRANNDVYLRLSCSAVELNPIYEVFIGGWSNARAINNNLTETDASEKVTPIKLYSNEFKGFWVRWNNGTISAGNDGETVPFLIYTDSERLMIEYVGVRSGWGASGSWTIEQGDKGHWVDVEHGTVPLGAYPGGEKNGNPVYIIRAYYSGGLIPGALLSGSTSFKDRESDDTDIASYEVLCDFGGNWKQVFENAIPNNAVVAGQTSDGEPLYVGRVKHEGSLIVGRVQANNEERMLCFIKYNDEEIESSDYEILVS